MATKYWQVCDIRAWSADRGTIYTDTFNADYVELFEMDDCKPELWYPDYCDNHRSTGCDDAEITVKLYPADCDIYDLPEPLFIASCWESEMDGWIENEEE